MTIPLTGNTGSLGSIGKRAREESSSAEPSAKRQRSGMARTGDLQPRASLTGQAPESGAPMRRAALPALTQGPALRTGGDGALAVRGHVAQSSPRMLALTDVPWSEHPDSKKAEAGNEQAMVRYEPHAAKAQAHVEHERNGHADELAMVPFEGHAVHENELAMVPFEGHPAPAHQAQHAEHASPAKAAQHTEHTEHAEHAQHAEHAEHASPAKAPEHAQHAQHAQHAEHAQHTEHAPASKPGYKADAQTNSVISQGDQQMANQAALAEATARSMTQQASLEYMKSMAEMAAKTTKSSGEALKGLA